MTGTINLKPPWEKAGTNLTSAEGKKRPICPEFPVPEFPGNARHQDGQGVYMARAGCRNTIFFLCCARATLRSHADAADRRTCRAGME